MGIIENILREISNRLDPLAWKFVCTYISLGYLFLCVYGIKLKVDDSIYEEMLYFGYCEEEPSDMVSAFSLDIILIFFISLTFGLEVFIIKGLFL